MDTPQFSLSSARPEALASSRQRRSGKERAIWRGDGRPSPLNDFPLGWWVFALLIPQTWQIHYRRDSFTVQLKFNRFFYWDNLVIVLPIQYFEVYVNKVKYTCWPFRYHMKWWKWKLVEMLHSFVCYYLLKRKHENIAFRYVINVD